MPKLIQDEFTDLNISPQRRYQLRREAEGCCRLCGERATPGHPYCAKHLPMQREAQRTSNRAKRMNQDPEGV